MHIPWICEHQCKGVVLCDQLLLVIIAYSEYMHPPYRCGEFCLCNTHVTVIASGTVSDDSLQRIISRNRFVCLFKTGRSREAYYQNYDRNSRMKKSNGSEVAMTKETIQNYK